MSRKSPTNRLNRTTYERPEQLVITKASAATPPAVRLAAAISQHLLLGSLLENEGEGHCP